MNELEAVVPPTRALTLGGTSVTIGPVTLGRLPGVVGALRPVAAQIAGFDAAAPDALINALIEHPTVLCDALIAATGLSADLVEGLDLAEGVDLASAVIELNLDFFARAVAPRLSTALGGVAAKPPSAA